MIKNNQIDKNLAQNKKPDIKSTAKYMNHFFWNSITFELRLKLGLFLPRQQIYLGSTRKCKDSNDFLQLPDTPRFFQFNYSAGPKQLNLIIRSHVFR